LIGTYIHEDGSKYEGEFVNGKREGKGVYYFSNKDKYDGEWKAGKMNGHGILSYHLRHL